MSKTRQSNKMYRPIDLYLFLDLNTKGLFITNDRNDPAYPFICQKQKHGVLRCNKHNLRKIFMSNGEFMNENQVAAIKKMKMDLIGEDTVGTSPKMIEQKHILELITSITKHLTQEQIDTILSNYDLDACDDDLDEAFDDILDDELEID